MQDDSALRSTACIRAWGDTSITRAPSGIFWRASANKTGETRLFTRYSAEAFFAIPEFHFSSGIDELTHFGDLFTGERITYKKN